jgi:SAM-dependent methyltransferase
VSRFADHFSAQSAAYAQHRPGYPDTLFELLANACQGRGLAWDVGTGNGQAALGLVARFDHVHATDPSADQLRHAPPHPRITWRVGAEDGSGLPAGSVDLVTAAQAAHWFDAGRFHTEAARVLRPGGVLAIWGYGLPRVDPAVDALLWDFYDRVLGAWWPPERHHIDSAYRELPFPWKEEPDPGFEMTARRTGTEFLGFLETWSALARCRQATLSDPLATFSLELTRLWPPEEPREVRWPLFLRRGRKPA